mmetsp:Transcript_16882/g.23619  ORF Transcript_16882/g.23619 Transcript_16882/m.23619 type:complete len:164 (-) Transcript_16882:341-832(-)|eukprot:CAMPEP_0184494612 /NCGR_PEP_ID=MMETSP0113_2-20130426/29125_1 /TAXON_ID=91329 /ORGANISM="Norrisiella sphaerica, Strain BC52" /LENGTH=163 /DNA_ID=CAMNT_0026880431 /DNA_START=148 /DNA_END=639 /DNA_ORIENTATION=+
MGLGCSKSTTTAVSDFKTGKKVKSGAPTKQKNHPKTETGGTFFRKVEKETPPPSNDENIKDHGELMKSKEDNCEKEGSGVVVQKVQDNEMVMEDIDEVSEIGDSSGRKPHKKAVSPGEIDLGPNSLFQRDFVKESKNAEFFLNFTKNRVDKSKKQSQVQHEIS